MLLSEVCVLTPLHSPDNSARCKPKERGRYFSDLRPWSADCSTRVSIYDKSTTIKTIHLHVNTAANTVTRVDEDGQSYTFRLSMALPSRYSPLPDMEVYNDNNEIYMLTTSEQLGGYAFYNRYQLSPSLYVLPVLRPMIKKTKRRMRAVAV
jgi:hypothetical protein